MEYNIPKAFRQFMALLLCAAMLLPAFPMPARATETDETAAAAVEASESLLREKFTWTVDNVNYYEKGDVIILYDNWATEIAGGATFSDKQTVPTEAASASWQAFVNGEYKLYTAFIIENLNNGAASSYEYFVDAVIDGAKYSDEQIMMIQSHTSNGCVLLIPTAKLTEANTPSRGDLVDPDFWYGNDITGNSAVNGGTLVFGENPASGVNYVKEADVANVNATVKLFNYDEKINTQGAGLTSANEEGFVFWAGYWGYGGAQETVDGRGQEESTAKGVYRYPGMSSALDNGYPKLSDGTSLAYLFNGASTRQDGSSTQVAAMTNGGGLFQKDENGYYYYDSLLNAAYYDESSNEFILYDNLAVRPWYNSADGTDYKDDGTGTWVPIAPGSYEEAYGNFLPFNKVTSDNITIDGSVAHNITTGEAYPAGSLESVGLSAVAAKKVLTGSKGVSAALRDGDTANGEINSNVTTARLEENPDMWFGMEVEFDFSMPEGGLVNCEAMTFDFHGDDDVFVYVGVWNEETKAYDYKLVLDIGGVHNAHSGSINFATGAVTDAPATYNDINSDEANYSPRSTTLKEIFGLSGDTFEDYTKLSLKFFYMERGGNISYCRLRFNIPTLPDESLTVTKELSAASADVIEESYAYQFRVVEDDGATPYFKAETKYTILENGVAVGTGKLGADGIFKLKAGQSAQFEEVLANSANGHNQYVVQELLPTDIAGQYDAVQCSVGGAASTAVTGTTEENFTVYSSSEQTADQTHAVAFRNVVDLNKLGTLTISKALAEDDSTLKNETFRLEVTLADELLPVGTAYTVGGETKTVETAGEILLKAGQTATVSGILSGCEYAVRERTTNGYVPTFSGTVEGKTDSASGTFLLGSTVAITVTNTATNADLIVDKTVEETDDPDKFELTLEAYATGNGAVQLTTKPADIVLVVDQSASMYTPAGMTVDRLYADKDHADNVAIPESAKVSDFVAKVNAGDTTILENAKHAGYYIAVHNNYDYLYVVQYAQYTDGDKTKWGWFYVPIDVTTRPVTFDTEHSTDNGSVALFTGTPSEDTYGNPIYYDSKGNPVANLRVNDFGTYAQTTKEILNNVTYYKTQYGELYDAIKKFVADLSATEKDGVKVDHRIAIVGFSSPFYDAMDYYSGTGLYIDGQYYLYDTDYKYKGKYVKDTLVRDDAEGTVVLDPDTGFAGNTFVAKEATAAETAFLPMDGQYSNALVSTKDNLASINASIEAITTNYMQTCPAVGIRIARSIFRGQEIPLSNSGTVALDTSEREKLIVLFTDGVPTVSLDTDYDNAVSEDVKEKYEHWHILAGAASTINEATLAKQEGISIYTIGTGAAENLSIREDQGVGDWELPFLEVVSSDYPNASASFVINYGTDSNGETVNTSVGSSKYTVVSGDKVKDEDFSQFTSSDYDLDLVFDSILSSVTVPTANLNGSAVLREVLSDYFVLDNNSEVDIKVYRQPYNGNGTWGDLVALEGATVTLSSSDGSERKDTIEVSGFDYASEYVSESENHYGSKLVVKVTIERRDGFWGGNNVPTNENATGIYSKGEIIEPFPIPEANVPLDLDVVAKDKTIYYGGDVTAQELIDSVKAGGAAVTVNSDGTFTPEESWMDDYAQLEWTDGFSAPGTSVSSTQPGDYTFEIRMTPLKDGKNNESDPGNIAGVSVSGVGMTDSDSGHVYILVPEITFKDSTATLNADAGDYAYKDNNHISTTWVQMESSVPTDAPAVSGDVPELTLTYTPERDTFTQDTRVNVTVSSSDPDGDISSVTTYKWQTCAEDLHNNAVHGTIGAHKANGDSIEFWVHVAGDSDKDLIVNKTVAATTDPNKFELTLDAYALGETDTISVTKPADIVLVLDHSGSMRTPVGAPDILKSGVKFTGGTEIPRNQISVEKAKQRGYYVAQSAQVSSEGEPTYTWFVMEYVTNYVENGVEYGERWVGYSVPETQAIVDTNGNYTEHTQTLTWVPGSVDGRLVFYKSQYAMLYDAVHEFVDDLKGSGVEHNVAIVGFAGSEGDGTRLYVGGDETAIKSYEALYHVNTTDARRTELYQKSLKNVQDETEYAQLQASIEAIETNYSYTCPSAGLKIAADLFKANEVNLAERDRIVVLFTDGIPNRQIGEGDGINVDATKQDAIYDEIVRYAYSAKSTYGAKIHSISTTTLGAGADRKFLSYASSDYPNAVSYSDPGAAIGEEAVYTHEVDAELTLDVIFGKITSEASSTSVTLDETAIMKEVLSDYIQLDADAEVKWEVFTQAYKGNGEWGDLVPFNAEVATTAVDGRIETIEVSGFDYADEYVSDTARTVNGADYYGSKLVLKVYVETRDGFWGGNNVPTNKSTTAIYSDGTLVEPFPEPEVNVPIDVTVTAKDKTIYYGGEIDSDGDGSEGDELITKVTIGDEEVTVNNDGTFTPKEDWMDDFADASWADDSTTPGSDLSSTVPDDYDYSVTVTPKYDGTANRSENPSNIAGNIDGGTVESDDLTETTKTAEDTGHVYILVPELTFKDSTTEFGTPADGYDYKGSDYVETEWVNKETNLPEGTVVPPVSGEEPKLDLTYRAENDVFVTDTKVEVTITSSNTEGDITKEAIFKWEDDCENDFHDEEGNPIGDHVAATENQNEFWVHVAIAIQPDTVVIDYGLPVDIDILSNDPDPDTVTRTFVGISEKNKDSFAKGENSDVKGEFGVLSVNADETVRYTLNKSNGMQMNKEEVFDYQVSYKYAGDAEIIADDVTVDCESTITVIPATSIYYEDDFVSYSVWNVSDDSENTEKEWTDTDPDAATSAQAQDRPGKLTVNDANNIYGYDGAYTSMATYSMGSSKKVTVDSNVYAEAQFTFQGTGFDVVSLTSNLTGTILVDVYKTDDFKLESGDNYSASKVESHMVDTYYGYQYVNGEWAVDPEATDTLYQVPVMKVSGLDYGKYTVVITAAYKKSLDHQNRGSYDFYLDAIRIYDPANDGKDNTTIKDAYTQDGEGWPEYFELRNLIISKNDFDNLDNETGSGIVFIDNTKDTNKNTTYTIADYTNYGPNNELYLAPGQAVAFNLYVGDPSDTCKVAGIHLAMKTVGGTAKVSVYDASKSKDDSVTPTTIETATDLYYDITALNGETVVITNTGSTESDSTDAILSITNVKVTYTAAHTDGIEASYFTTTQNGAEAAVASLMMLAEPEEPEIFEPETFKVKLSGISVKAGSSVTVTATTSDDVESITVNGVTVTKYTTNRRTGERTWRARVKAESAGQLAIRVTACNADGLESAAVTRTVVVRAGNSNTVSWLETMLNGLLGRLLGKLS